jgi:hypothetical protein
MMIPIKRNFENKRIKGSVGCEGPTNQKKKEKTFF